MSTPTDVSPLDLGAMMAGVAGGLALFLYGMRKMTDALTTLAGTGMKSFLGRATTNRFTAAGAGAAVTAVLQSSSVTTVLVVGFVSTGLLTLSQSVGVIVGANVGSTLTAQIIAFKVTEYALSMIAIGFLIELVARRKRWKYYGIVLMGLGLIFLGMSLMGEAATPLRTYQPFVELMKGTKNPLLAIAVAAAFTALVQSSAATIGLVIVMAAEGLVSLEAGIALLFGSNLGTCITAILAAIGRPREAVRAAVVHVLFNFLGVLLWLAFIPQFAEVVRDLSPAYPEVEAGARQAFETPRQIANAHTLFNVGNAAVFIWFTGPIAMLARRLVPEARRPSDDPAHAVYLNEFYLQQPDLALDRARLEIVRLGENVLHMVEASFHAAATGLPGEVGRLQDQESHVDALHGEIITFLGRLSLAKLVDPQPRRIYEFIAVANDLENAADVVGRSLARTGKKRNAAQVRLSEETCRLLTPLHEAALEAGRTALRSFAEFDPARASKVPKSKSRFNRLAEQAHAHLLKRLTAEEPDRVATFRIESDIIDDYKRLHTLFRRLAKTAVEVGRPATPATPAPGPRAASDPPEADA